MNKMTLTQLWSGSMISIDSYQERLSLQDLSRSKEWLDLFKAGGLKLVEEELRDVDISSLKIAPRFANMDKRDLATTVVRLTLRKPGGA